MGTESTQINKVEMSVGIVKMTAFTICINMEVYMVLIIIKHIIILKFMSVCLVFLFISDSVRDG